MLNENKFTIYHLPFSIHHLNFIPEFIQKGTHRVPFCIPPLCFMLYALFFNLYSKTTTKFIPAGDSNFVLFALLFVLCYKKATAFL
jgi:hypothetical protein